MEGGPKCGLLLRWSYLGPASGSGPGPAGSWTAGHRCWRWFHRPAAQTLQGQRCPWQSAAARSSSGSETRRRLRGGERGGVYGGWGGAYLVDGQVDACVRDDAQHVGHVAFVEGSQALLPEDGPGTVQDPQVLARPAQSQAGLQDLRGGGAVSEWQLGWGGGYWRPDSPPWGRCCSERWPQPENPPAASRRCPAPPGGCPSAA